MTTITAPNPTPRRGRRILRAIGKVFAWVLLALGATASIAGITTFLMRTPLTEAGKARCLALAGREIGSGRVTKADPVAGGPTIFWKIALIGVPTIDLPPSCRVTLLLSPQPGSKIGTQVWLPEQGWNGKYQGIGNGGLAGAIDDLSLTVALHRGYAAAATDTGHVAAADDGDWALGNPVAVADYGYRAIHETAVAAKQVISLFYGRPPRFSYFGSGSNGGREALLEAQRYPDDYIGIVAGAPALDMTGGLANWEYLQSIAVRTPGAWLDKADLKTINHAVLAACDRLDGVADGVLEDPRGCTFQPASLLCRPGQTQGCLSSPQVQFLDAIYRGSTADGRYGYARGGELEWPDWLVGGKHFNLERRYLREYIGKMAQGEPNWDVARNDWRRDQAALDRVLGPLNALDPDLSRFRARGGKLILYHGWSDPALPPGTTIAYFDAMRAKMGAPALDGFARLYMAPGVAHVVGGPGPNVFGQLVPAGNASPDRDVGAAIEAWVEKGKAPGAIRASRYDSMFRPLITQTGTPTRTHLLCPYPAFERWRGRGSVNQADSFVCATRPLA